MKDLDVVNGEFNCFDIRPSLEIVNDSRGRLMTGFSLYDREMYSGPRLRFRIPDHLDVVLLGRAMRAVSKLYELYKYGFAYRSRVRDEIQLGCLSPNILRWF